MAGRIFFPDARNRSSTAVPGKSDLRDENIYSSIVVGNGGGGIQLIFTNPQGQSIPQLVGSSVVVSQAQHKNYTDLTTNLVKAGELGASIGDAAIRALGATIETAVPNSTTGAYNSWGATPYDVVEVLNKCFFRLEIAGKKQIQGQLFSFPSLGGPLGALSTTANNSSSGVITNGLPGRGRCLKIPIMIARTDTLNGVFGVAGAATLSFDSPNASSGTSGQETLVWVNLLAAVRGDVR
jgi:hypothetical protein